MGKTGLFENVSSKPSKEHIAFVVKYHDSLPKGRAGENMAAQILQKCAKKLRLFENVHDTFDDRLPKEDYPYNSDQNALKRAMNSHAEETNNLVTSSTTAHEAFNIEEFKVQDHIKEAISDFKKNGVIKDTSKMTPAQKAKYEQEQRQKAVQKLKDKMRHQLPV